MYSNNISLSSRCDRCKNSFCLRGKSLELGNPYLNLGTKGNFGFTKSILPKTKPDISCRTNTLWGNDNYKPNGFWKCHTSNKELFRMTS